jgi:hypothetical protein
MNYAEKLRDIYFENKDRINKHRKEQGLSYILTLEDKLNDGFKEYKAFCYNIGIKPKKLSEFLKSEII